MQVWRQPHEVYVKSTVRRRVVALLEVEFMSWCSFSYDKKGSFHIWRAETAAEKK